MLGIKPDVWSIEDSALANTTIVINASPLGMVGKAPLNLSFDAMKGTQTTKTIFDMVYAPLETPLLAGARRHGFKVIDGLQMLIAQAAEAFALFFDQPPPREYDDELRALLIK
jgi:shikimate dehydrogenase